MWFVEVLLLFWGLLITTWSERESKILVLSAKESPTVPLEHGNWVLGSEKWGLLKCYYCSGGVDQHMIQRNLCIRCERVTNYSIGMWNSGPVRPEIQRIEFIEGLVLFWGCWSAHNLIGKALWQGYVWLWWFVNISPDVWKASGPLNFGNRYIWYSYHVSASGVAMIRCSVVLLACDRARLDAPYLGKNDTKDLTCDQARWNTGDVWQRCKQVFGNNANFIARSVGDRAKVNQQSRWSITWSLSYAISNLRSCNACSDSDLKCWFISSRLLRVNIALYLSAMAF